MTYKRVSGYGYGMGFDYGSVISFYRLKDCIREHGTSIKSVAEMVGKRPAHLSNFINGRAWPMTDLVAKVCWALRVPASEVCAFSGIEPSEYQREWFGRTGTVYRPSEDAAGDVTYRPLRRVLEAYLRERNAVNGAGDRMSADDFFDKVDAPRRRDGMYDKSGAGIAAAMTARGYTPGTRTETRRRRDYSVGLPYPTRTKLRNDRPVNIRTVYELCKALGCGIDFVMSYK